MRAAAALLLAALLALATATVAGADGPAEPLPGGHGFVCYNAHGYPIPQEQPTCPPCWQGSPPANPLPLGTADPCTAGLLPHPTPTELALTPPATAAPAIDTAAAPPSPVVIAPAFTG